ncbi:alpha/beta-hydrolase [Choiromyces venosus 120613-1]|uniref:Carboxypeptidase n=1 Tax=Choiromyces venosus 120613-1 TaxID=1336337 RepID=A0A3N4JIS9_9PEZI|nr:alpha/beta-hydrolase [Choiromyces venosus 120613-1]
MPISTRPKETRKLYFWFFPTTGAVDEELVIWLNGGPGCSDLEGLLQENGPFSWQTGTFKPVPNYYSWNNLTNMIWVEQPVGTGFSQGTPSARSEEDVAEQFLGFLENFIKTFGFENKKLYVTGESYAGVYVPYIVDAMYKKNNKTLFDPRGLMIYDPVLSPYVIQEQIAAAAFVDYWAHLFALNQTTMDRLHSTADKCGYTRYLNENLLNTSVECDVWTVIFEAALLVNPCFNMYQITTTCPVLWDVLGFPGSFTYLPEGAQIYFNRTEVQDAINAPRTNWEECSSIDVFPQGDSSDPSSWKVLPRVIDKNERTIIAHGLLDFLLIPNGTLLTIQNMTWGGQQGFRTKPFEPFVVPYESQGTMGVTHTERKLTWMEIQSSGHMVPLFQPVVAYRQLEYLIGRINKL